MGTALQRHRPRITEGLIMRWHHRLYVSLRGLLAPSSIDRDLDDELRFHFDQQVERALKQVEFRHLTVP